jgi:transaldolase
MGRDSYPPAEDPGVQSVTEIYNYYKKFGYQTEVMGASFRNIDEIRELAGCDLLTISPALLAQLNSTIDELPRKLDPAQAVGQEIAKIPMDKALFEQMHAADRMATEKLDEGIKGFTKALEALEQLLAERLSRLDSKKNSNQPVADLFQVYDLDGDGFITREEWMGTDAVFDALDHNKDGKITAEEMGAGLGAVLQLAKAA